MRSKVALTGSGRELTSEPHASHRPVVVDGSRGDVERLSDLPVVKPDEDLELGDTCGALAPYRELAERLIELEDLDLATLEAGNLGERHTSGVLASPRRCAAPCMIHQHASHGASGDTDHVLPVAPGDIVTVGETNERLVNERRRLERVVGSFAAERSGRHAPELLVEELEDSRRRRGQASLITAQSGEKPRDIRGGHIVHGTVEDIKSPAAPAQTPNTPDDLAV